VKVGHAIAIPHVTEAPELVESHPRDAAKLSLIDAILAAPDHLAPERPEPVRIYDQPGNAFAAARADFRREASWILGQPWQDREPNAIRTEFATACEKHVELIRDDIKRERARQAVREALSPKRFGPKAAEKAFTKLLAGWTP
jgi:hypothetical protein